MSSEDKITLYIDAPCIDDNRALEMTYDLSNDYIYIVINGVNYYIGLTLATIKQNPEFIHNNYLVDFVVENLESCNIEKEPNGTYCIKWTSPESKYTITVNLIAEPTELELLREENAMLKKQLAATHL